MKNERVQELLNHLALFLTVEIGFEIFTDVWFEDSQWCVVFYFEGQLEVDGEPYYLYADNDPVLLLPYLEDLIAKFKASPPMI